MQQKVAKIDSAHIDTVVVTNAANQTTYRSRNESNHDINSCIKHFEFSFPFNDRQLTPPSNAPGKRGGRMT